MTRRIIQVFGVLISFFMLSICSAGELKGICTGFFITSDGYVGTAAHCYSKKLTGTVYYHGQNRTLRLKVIAVDRKHDTMLLKMDVQDVAYFKLSTAGWWKGQNVAYTGYPDPWRYGWNKSSYRGKVERGDISKYGTIYSDIWSRPGTSGSCVHDSKGACIGILTEGVLIAGIQVHTGLRPIQYLIILALKSNASVEFDPTPGGQINNQDLDAFRIENGDKVVLINVY